MVSSGSVKEHLSGLLQAFANVVGLEPSLPSLPFGLDGSDGWMTTTTSAITCAVLLAAVLMAWLVLPRRSRAAAAASRGLKPMSSLPTPPGASLLMGHLPLLARGLQMHLRLTEWTQQLGGMYRLRLAHRKVLVVTDPHVANPLLSAGPDALPKSSLLYGAAKVGSSYSGSADGIAAVTHFQDPYYREIRNTLVHAFAMEAQRKETFPNSSTAVQRMCDRWAKALSQGSSVAGGAGISVPMMDMEMQLMVLDSLLRSAFQIEMSEDELQKFVDTENEFCAEIMRRVMNPLRKYAYRWLPFLPWSKNRREVIHACIDMWQYVYDHIRARAPYSPDDRTLSALLWRLKEEYGHSDDQMTANIGTMILAGHHTTASQTGWIMYNVARNPAVQERVVEELRGAGLLTTEASPGRAVEWADLANLEYLNAVVNEGMRLNPVVGSSGTLRQADRDVDIAGIHVPKGTIVWIPVVGMHCANAVWGDGMKYRPERWLADPADGGVSSDAKAAFLPFGRGPRNCIGMSMGMVSMKVYVIEMLRRFWFDLHPCMGSEADVREREEMAFLLHVRGGMHLVPRLHVK